MDWWWSHHGDDQNLKNFTISINSQVDNINIFSYFLLFNKFPITYISKPMRKKDLSRTKINNQSTNWSEIKII